MISAIICTHNPREDYLRRVLATLQAQTLPKEKWELLLVDNASAEALSGKWDLSWHPNARHVRESELGLTPARLRGIAESNGELLVFVDDDNLLTEGYLSTALSISARTPFLGCIGGTQLGAFEIEPHDRYKSLLPMLALRKVSAELWTNDPRIHNLRPWGAGLCVRRQVTSDYQKLLASLSIPGVVDRKGNVLTSGGDDLFSWACQLSGLGFGLSPELELTHLIPAARLTDEYFIRLVEGHSFSNTVLKYVLEGQLSAKQSLPRRTVDTLQAWRKGLFVFRVLQARTRGYRAGIAYLQRHSPKPLNMADLGSNG